LLISALAGASGSHAVVDPHIDYCARFALGGSRSTAPLLLWAKRQLCSLSARQGDGSSDHLGRSTRLIRSRNPHKSPVFLEVLDVTINRTNQPKMGWFKPENGGGVGVCTWAWPLTSLPLAKFLHCMDHYGRRCLSSFSSDWHVHLHYICSTTVYDESISHSIVISNALTSAWGGTYEEAPGVGACRGFCVHRV
jgi:hypothetical protein